MTSRSDDLDSIATVEHAEFLLAALAEADAVTPPRAVRRALLAHAVRTPRRGADPVGAAAVYRARVEDLAAVIDSLAGGDWQPPAQPYAWPVHGLVAHLLVIERYTAAQLGVGTMPAGDQLDHLGLGADVIAAELREDPRATGARWRDTAAVIADHVSAPTFDPQGPLPLHHWPFQAETALVVRGFELWTHADDIRRAVGRPLEVPAPGELRTMSTTSVTSLPLALAVVAPDVPMQPTRFVLTGAGGGTFDLSTEIPGERNLVAMDVVDYCRVVARRITADELDCDVEGDPRLTRALLEAAAIVAM
jgi:uncharacterized protein (TIGR03083 family)